MSLREEILDTIEDYYDKKFSSLHARDTIMDLIEKRIDEMIEIDNQTITMKHGLHEGKIAAQASRNTLTLIKEMLK